MWLNNNSEHFQAVDCEIHTSWNKQIDLFKSVDTLIWQEQEKVLQDIQSYISFCESQDYEVDKELYFKWALALKQHWKLEKALEYVDKSIEWVDAKEEKLEGYRLKKDILQKQLDDLDDEYEKSYKKTEEILNEIAILSKQENKNDNLIWEKHLLSQKLLLNTLKIMKVKSWKEEIYKKVKHMIQDIEK